MRYAGYWFGSKLKRVHAWWDRVLCGHGRTTIALFPLDDGRLLATITQCHNCDYSKVDMTRRQQQENS